MDNDRLKITKTVRYYVSTSEVELTVETEIPCIHGVNPDDHEKRKVDSIRSANSRLNETINDIMSQDGSWDTNVFERRVD